MRGVFRALGLFSWRADGVSRTELFLCPFPAFTVRVWGAVVVGGSRGIWLGFGANLGVFREAACTAVIDFRLLVPLGPVLRSLHPILMGGVVANEGIFEGGGGLRGFWVGLCPSGFCCCLRHQLTFLCSARIFAHLFAGSLAKCPIQAVHLRSHFWSKDSWFDFFEGTVDESVVCLKTLF